VRYAQAHPTSLIYEYLGQLTRLLTFADSAFKKEESTGHALKGWDAPGVCSKAPLVKPESRSQFSVFAKYSQVWVVGHTHFK
jgi:hypothetical protein